MLPLYLGLLHWRWKLRPSIYNHCIMYIMWMRLYHDYFHVILYTGPQDYNISYSCHSWLQGEFPGSPGPLQYSGQVRPISDWIVTGAGLQGVDLCPATGVPGVRHLHQGPHVPWSPALYMMFVNYYLFAVHPSITFIDSIFYLDPLITFYVVFFFLLSIFICPLLLTAEVNVMFMIFNLF